MAQLQKLKHSLADAATLKLLSTSLVEISAIRMKGIKTALAENEEFYTDMQRLYHAVLFSSEHQGLIPVEHKKEEIRVALTSNRHFYGLQNIHIMEQFLSDLRKKPADAFVIGNTGSVYIRQSGKHAPLDELVFKDDMPTTREMYAFLDRVRGYKRVKLYHPHFISLMQQDVAITDITYHADTTHEKKEEPLFYIYEPELGKILDFFETHVRFLLFRRSLLEVDLARTSARLVSMVGAEQRSTAVAQRLSNQITRARQNLINMRIIESLSGIRKWQYHTR